MVTIYALYVIENDMIDIRYIGQTKNFKNRVAQWKYQLNHLDNERERGPKLKWIKEVVLKRGLNLQFLEIDQVEDSEGDLYERHYISLFRSWGFNLLNSQNGGKKNFSLKEDQKRNIALRQKDRASKEGGFFKGHNHSEENKEKWRKEAIERANRGFIYQYDLEGNLIQIWKCGYKTIAEKLGKEGSSILDCLNNKTRKAYGFLWLYEKEISEEILKERVYQIKHARKKKHSPILQFDLNGNFIAKYSRRCDLKNLFKHLTAITYCLNGYYNNANGYIWIYEDEYEKDHSILNRKIQRERKCKKIL